MKLQSAILTLLCTVLTVSASLDRSIPARNATLFHRASAPSARKRCRSRPTSRNLTNLLGSSNQLPPPQNFGSAFTVTKGLINVQSQCGLTGATSKTSKESGPNGHIHWLNCGLTGGGWNPPHVEIDDLVYVSLTTAVQSPSSPFHACKPFIRLFEKYGHEFGVPGILLASFAMQESSCNPDTVGSAGEQGLMQITREKCRGVSNCKDPDFNIRTGAQFFANTLKANNNNVLLAVGAYNGWHRGLTFHKATAAAKSSCCRCQVNCDYLHQFFNGWLQNIDAYDVSKPLGVFFNLNIC